MELNQILKVMRRWVAVIVLAMLVVTVVAGWRAIAAGTIYESKVELQLTAPQSEDVLLFNTNRSSSNARDDMTVALNNFTEIVQNREVFRRVITQLALTGDDADYKIEVRSLRDSDYFDIVAQSKNAALVGQIANTHVNAAIAYYGEVRSKPAASSKAFLADQLTLASKRVQTAESSLADFQTQNHVTNVTTEVEIDSRILQDLISERNRRSLDGPTSMAINSANTVLTQLRVDRENANATGDAARVAHYDAAIQSYTQAISTALTAADVLAPVDKLITQYRDDLTRLSTLLPRLNSLQSDLDQARSDYQQLQAKYNEAVVKEQSTQVAGFIQVIEPALAPDTPVPGHVPLIVVLALVGGFIVGIALAFLLDSVVPVGTNSNPATPERQRKDSNVTQRASGPAGR
jgi:uncharacterized protein involved in exopolysaccharide biosynthesis